MHNLLMTPKYQALTVDGVVAKYAPGMENNTGAYQRFLTQKLGVSGGTSFSTLTAPQMKTFEQSIRTYEGYNPANPKLVGKTTFSYGH